MSYICVDCEFDGPVPGKYSMVCFGAIVVEPSLNKTFYGRTSPISQEFIPEALVISGFSRKEHLSFEHPTYTIKKFVEWIKENSVGRPIFISDNPGSDFAFINYYMHIFNNGENPFGHSARRIGDLYCGMVNDASKNFEWKKKFRKTNHDHHPVNDAKGNAEGILAMHKMGLKIDLR